jgi:SAM-dependent methyltransferase
MKGRQLDAESYERAFAVAQVFGTPAKYYSRTNIELLLPELEMEYGPKKDRQVMKGFKFWPMSNRRTVSQAFNIAPIGMSYGKQDAPNTYPAFGYRHSDYDAICIDYDDIRNAPGLNAPADGVSYDIERKAMWKVLLGDGRPVRHVLDIGAGTGSLLDWKLTPKKAEAYTAVEPSLGMMNQLVYKHGWVRNLVTAPIEAYLRAHEKASMGKLDTVVALTGSASYIDPDALANLLEKTDGRTVLSFFQAGTEVDPFSGTVLPDFAEITRQTALELPGAKSGRIGQFQIVRIDSRG